uniref:Uncharacterized protein n=1 Tax=Rhizophora mucronata TaxID=61149 RepID=A0A2P2NLY5_RHIMU
MGASMLLFYSLLHHNITSYSFSFSSQDQFSTMILQQSCNVFKPFPMIFIHFVQQIVSLLSKMCHPIDN